jgi:ComF family protein
MHGFVCSQCWTATGTFKTAQVVCWECGRLTTGIADQQSFFHCGKPLAFAHSCGAYKKGLRQAVLSLKREPHIPKYLSTLIREALNEIPSGRCTRVVPVPLHPKRLAARGFNQAEVIGKEVSALLDLPLDSVSLIRTVHTERHRAGMDAKARKETVTDAFAVQYARLIAGETILLVDDVFTSGATATACARVLLKSGANEVFLFTISRTE